MEFSDFIKIPKIKEAYIEGDEIPPCIGSICLTGHHVILYLNNKNKNEHWILHKNVDLVEKRIDKERCLLTLKCKDFKIYTISISDQEEGSSVAYSIEMLSSVQNINLQYPYFYKSSEDLPHPNLGSIEEDFLILSSLSDKWRICDLNKNFQVCCSYPQKFLVPTSVTDQMILKSSEFRSGGRFPVLSYFHTNGRVLMRSSEPLVGASNRRCKEDEQILNTVLQANHRGYIIDTRSQQTATNAKSKGRGTEPDFHYPQWKKIFHNLQKASTSHDSLCKIVEACKDKESSVEKYLSRVESSGWMNHVKNILNLSCLVAQCIDKEGASVMVHCGDGLDASLQVTSITNILLNSECRTMRGFLNLVEKEWILSGHPFRERCSSSAYNANKQREVGATFLLFLDCVHQLIHQYPLSFEFEHTMLVQLARHCYASQYGTFSCNNELERVTNDERSKTVSLWSHLLSEDSKYKNCVYKQDPDPIWPSVAPQSLIIWKGLFSPFADSSTKLHENLRASKNHLKNLNEEIESLEAEIQKLKDDSVENLIDF